MDVVYFTLRRADGTLFEFEQPKILHLHCIESERMSRLFSELCTKFFGVMTPRAEVKSILLRILGALARWESSGSLTEMELAMLTPALEHMAAADRADNADSVDNEELAGSAENSASGGKGRFKGLSAAADILRNYGQVLRFKPARLIVLTSVFYLISNSIMMADRMYFFTYNMELTAKEVSLIMLVMQVVSVLLVPPLIRINRVLDKRTLCIGGIGMSAACLTIYGFIGVSSVPHLLLLFLIYGIGSICYWQLIPSMLYDVCDADKLANGTDRAGLIISMQGLTESVFEAVGFQILGILLHMTGFQTDAARQSLETMQCIHVSFTFIPAFFALLALLMMIRYPITREKHAEIIKNLQQK
jgi:Na+/melibiose symporter-like transporter